MAKPYLNPVFEGLSRSIGNLTFFRRNGKTFTRRKSQPTGDPSSAQQAVRARFMHCVEDWKSLPSVIKKAWNTAARPGIGYNRFIGVNSSLYQKGELIRFSEEMGIPAPQSCSGKAGISGAFSVSYTRPNELTQAEITAFYRIIPAEGESRDPLSSVHQESSASGNVDITGVSPGREYEVYLIFSDKELNIAVQVSASAALKVTAGA